MGKVLFMRKGSKHTTPKQELPAGYTQLTHIQSSGTQYVDTLLKPNQDTRVVMDLQILESHSGEGHLCSARSTSSGPFWILYYNNSKYTTRYGTQAGVSFSLTDRNRNIFDKNKNVTKIDSTAIEDNYETFSVNANIPLLCRLTGTTADAFLSANLYSCQIYDNGTLVRDYVPCINESGEVGLFDMVGRKFYGNAGTGEFIAGDRLVYNLPAGYTQLAYIQSSGTQYVNTDIIPSNSIDMNVKFQLNEAQETGGIVSAEETWGTNMYSVDVWACRYNTTYKTNSFAADTDYTIRVEEGNFYINGELYFSGNAGNFAATIPLTIFAVNRGTYCNEYVKARLYSFKIYDNGNLVRDYVPCINDSGAVGLFDLTERKFYGNDGTGAFGAGDVVEYSLPVGYEELAYIQSSGEQYVDSGVIPKSNTRVVMDIHQTGTTSIKAAFGTRDTSSGTAPLAYLAWISSATSARSDYFGSSQTMTGTFDVRMIIDKNANVCTINGVSVTNTANSGQEAALTIFLFACNNSGTVNYQISAKVYSCQIYDNGACVRWYVPCITASGDVGLWDVITREFYGNAGTGVFTGSEVA